MSRRLVVISLVLVMFVGSVRAAVKIVVPPDGSQVLGKGFVEVDTDIPEIDRLEVYVDGLLAGVARRAPWRVPADFGDMVTSHRIEARVFSHRYSHQESSFVTTTGMSASQMVNVDLVEVPLKIRSARRVVARDLEIREDGTLQNILELKPTRSATHFTFVIDHSLSMAGGRLQAALAASRNALAELRPGDSAGIILFNHRVETVELFTRSWRAEETTPSGGTSLRDAVAAAAGAGRGIIIVVSDGDDRNSTLDEQRALRLVSKANVTLYALTLGRGAGSRFLENAASKSGGTCISSDRSSLSRDLNRLMNEINGSYVAEYQSSASERGWRNVVAIARGRGISILTSRKGYYSE